MSVFRINKTKNFTVMSNYHFKEKAMSLKAKGLLSLMLSLPDDWNYSISGLVRLSKDGKDSVMSALGELEKFGYLMRERTKDENGKFNGITYYIFEEPQTEFPIAEKPISENEKAGKPSSESPPQLNTKKLNTNQNKILYDINNYIDILDTIPDDHLRNLYCDFLESRYQMGDPLTTKGLNLLIERVRMLVGIDIERQKELLKNAIINNWKNVYIKGEERQESDIINNLKTFYEQ
jgi:hypothetical protein